MGQAEQAGDKWAVGIEVRVTYPSGVTLVAGSVGIGASRAEALETAIQEWVQLAGLAIVGDFVLKTKASERYEVAGAIVYPGATGIRGSQQPTWGKESHLKLLDQVVPAMGAVDDKPHSLSLTLVVDPTGAVEGDCRLDGQPAARILEAVKAFHWPKLAGPYMFKQYYVIERAQGAA